MCNPTTYQPDVLARYGFQPKDIKDIQQNQYTDTIQITLKNGTRIWINARIITSPREIKPILKIEEVKCTDLFTNKENK